MMVHNNEHTTATTTTIRSRFLLAIIIIDASQQLNRDTDYTTRLLPPQPYLWISII